MRKYEHPEDMINELMDNVLEKYRNSIPRKAFMEAMREAAQISFVAREEEKEDLYGESDKHPDP